MTDNSQANIELEGNASRFGVFAAIRAAILEAETKYSGSIQGDASHSSYSCCVQCVATCKLGEPIHCRCHQNRRLAAKLLTGNDTEDEGDDTDETTQRELVQQVPQIVGAGLRTMFELIAEAKHIHPELCTRALKALFDVIQGQYPESFKSEPDALIEQLYDLLLDMATFNGTSAGGPDTSYSWSAVACSALLGLCVARGDTGKMLKAIAAMLMSPPAFSTQSIQLPTVLNILQRSVLAVALKRPTLPDIIRNGIPINSHIGSFAIDLNHQRREHGNVGPPSIAGDGQHLYILSGRGLFKVGTGFGGTLKGFVYAANEEFGKDVNGWLGYANVSIIRLRFRCLNYDKELSLSLCIVWK